MTVEQRRLVRENMGLVAVHLRRHVANLAVPRRDREWEDLFQEGCLGLIQAARAFQPERGIPFAAFALPRIHNAVSKALQSKFATVRVPPKRAVRSKVDDVPASEPRECPHRPKVCSLSDELAGRLADQRHGDMDARPGETIGDRLRCKYDSAVTVACAAVSKGPTRRGDRHRLVRMLAEERFLVPREESRRALRQIARDTQSSYARVAQYDKQLGQAIRRVLEVDPEFRELQRRVRTAPIGRDAPVDEELERRLTGAGAEEFVRRFTLAPPAQRAQMVHAVLAMSQDDVAELVRTHFTSLPATARERLLRETADLGNRLEAETPGSPVESARPRSASRSCKASAP